MSRREEIVREIRRLAEELMSMGDEPAQVGTDVFVQLEDEPWDPTELVVRSVINEYHRKATINRAHWDTYAAIADEPEEAFFEVLDTASEMDVAYGPIYDQLHDAFGDYVVQLKHIVACEQEEA